MNIKKKNESFNPNDGKLKSANLFQNPLAKNPFLSGAKGIS